MGRRVTRYQYIRQYMDLTSFRLGESRIWHGRSRARVVEEGCSVCLDTLSCFVPQYLSLGDSLSVTMLCSMAVSPGVVEQCIRTSDENPSMGYYLK